MPTNLKTPLLIVYVFLDVVWGVSHAGQAGLSLPELQACTTMQVGVCCDKDRFQGFMYARQALPPGEHVSSCAGFFFSGEHSMIHLWNSF